MTRATIDAVAPFFAIVARDSAMLFLKGSGEAVPNAKRYAWARFDAYFLVPDPDALATEFRAARRQFQRVAQGHARRTARV